MFDTIYFPSLPRIEKGWGGGVNLPAHSLANDTTPVTRATPYRVEDRRVGGEYRGVVFPHSKHTLDLAGGARVLVRLDAQVLKAVIRPLTFVGAPPWTKRDGGGGTRERVGMMDLLNAGGYGNGLMVLYCCRNFLLRVRFKISSPHTHQQVFTIKNRYNPRQCLRCRIAP